MFEVKCMNKDCNTKSSWYKELFNKHENNIDIIYDKDLKTLVIKCKFCGSYIEIE